MVILAQVLASFAILFWVISILLKNKKNILLMQVIANGIYGIEYLLLGAFSAASMNFLSFLRLLVYYFYALLNIKMPKWILFVFIALVLLFGIITYDGLISLLPIIITVLYTYAFWQNNLNVARIIYIVAAIIWIYYNYEVGAYVGIIGNALEITTGLISLIKYRGGKK